MLINRLKRFKFLVLILGIIFFTPFPSYSQNSAYDSIQVGGSIPAIVFSSITIDQSKLTFNPHEQVRNRVIGKIFFRYNVPLDAIEISSNRPNGVPSHDEFGPYPFGRYGFEIKIGPCPGLNSSTTNPISFSSIEYTPTNIVSHEKLKTGIIATCELLASWDGAENSSMTKNVFYTIDFYLSLSPNR